MEKKHPFQKTSFTAKRAKSTCTNRRVLIKIVQVLNKTVVFSIYLPKNKKLMILSQNEVTKTEVEELES